MSVLSAFVFSRLSGFLVCIVWSCFFFVVLFWFFVFWVFSVLSKMPQKKDTAKTKKNADKWTFFQLSKLCSQLVFLRFWGGLKESKFWLKTKEKLFEEILKGKHGQNMSKKVDSKIGPRLSQKLVQVCCTTELDQFLTQKIWKCLSYFPFFEKFILPAEKKGKKEENLDQFLTQMWQKLDHFWLYSIHKRRRCEVSSGPISGFLKVGLWTNYFWLLLFLFCKHQGGYALFSYFWTEEE